MKQILQALNTGVTTLAEVPCPAPMPGRLLIRTTQSLVSAGTERMLVDFGKASLIGKAMRQPERVQDVLNKIRVDGLAPTLSAVRNKLDQPLPLGYCNVGRVIGVGKDAGDFRVGDRVVSNGGHAEVVSAPVNLCARVPDAVRDEDAAFTVLAAIALQGIRLAAPTLGEAVVVTGLGLIGQLAVQLLLAQGCRVLGIDPDPSRRGIAESFGATAVDPADGGAVPAALAFSRGRGVDAVLVTASTQSSEPMHQAAQMSRKRGRIVLVGVTGLELSRADFYEKELTFQVSCSYGPGRYDPAYEDKGQDYPVGFVRWTEQRNFEAVLDQMAAGRLDLQSLISHRFAFSDAVEAYELLLGQQPALGIVLDYAASNDTDAVPVCRTISLPVAAHPGKAGIGFIGAGNYAVSTLMPAFAAAGARLQSVSSSRGVSGAYAGRKFGFAEATTDTQSLLNDERINAVVIATPHHTHAGLAARALTAGKHTFVEKPLALTEDDLDHVTAALEGCGQKAPLLMVGFNRRFSPHIQRIRALLDAGEGPWTFIMTVNAGAIPREHWTQDKAVGGGRIAGEACHFIDLLRFLAGAPIIRHTTVPTRTATDDTASISLSFANGCAGTIHYVATGHRAVAKERLDIFGGGRILQLDNFRRLQGYGWPGFRRMSLWKQDKGQKACVDAFVRAVEMGGPPPIPLNEILEVSRVTIEVAQEMRA